MSDESFREFQVRLEAASLAMVNGDSSAWEQLYSHEPDATLFGGWGGHEKGWEQLSARWKMVSGRYRSGTVEIERLAEHIAGDIAVTVQIVRGTASFADGSSGRTALRVTHVCRREQGQWRLVHRPTSRCGPAPSRITSTAKANPRRSATRTRPARASRISRR
jgi:ketosteroid isomerase-like protein